MSDKEKYLPPHMRDQDTINNLVYTDHSIYDLTDDVYSTLSSEPMQVIEIEEELEEYSDTFPPF